MYPSDSDLIFGEDKDKNIEQTKKISSTIIIC